MPAVSGEDILNISEDKLNAPQDLLVSESGGCEVAVQLRIIP